MGGKANEPGHHLRFSPHPPHDHQRRSTPSQRVQDFPENHQCSKLSTPLVHMVYSKKKDHTEGTPSIRTTLSLC